MLDGLNAPASAKERGVGNFQNPHRRGWLAVDELDNPVNQRVGVLQCFQDQCQSIGLGGGRLNLPDERFSSLPQLLACSLHREASVKN